MSICSNAGASVFSGRVAAVSDQTPPRDDEQPTSPFPESSLGSSEEPQPASEEHPQADAPPADAQPPGPEPEPSQPIGAQPRAWQQPEAAPSTAPQGPLWGESTGPAPAGAGEWSQPQPGAPGPGSSLWSEQPAPQYAPPTPPPEYAPPAPAPGPFVSGDPLAGPSYPHGYTSPPPPGAGGLPPTGPPMGAPAVFGAGTYVLSGWWRRVGAALIDGLIIGVVAIILMAPLGIGLFSTDETTSDGDFIALVGGLILTMIVVAIVALAYAPVMMGATNGKTLGRMVTGIRVVRADGQRMTFGWAALREVVVKALLINGVAGSFTFGLAGLLDVLWPLWDDQNRALHDFVVNTRTIID
jgi:uncharacterized RDD family membrane protein YckC